MLMFRNWRAFIVSWALLVIATVLLCSGMSYWGSNAPPLTAVISSAALFWGGVVIFFGLFLSFMDAMGH